MRTVALAFMEFRKLFEKAMGAQASPFGFQRQFAAAADLPSTLRVPTGLGKTATVVLGWLWRRFHGTEVIRRNTPRRLVYCLPMRTLAAQTAGEARRWSRPFSETFPSTS